MDKFVSQETRVHCYELPHYRIPIAWADVMRRRDRPGWRRRMTAWRATRRAAVQHYMEIREALNSPPSPPPPPPSRNTLVALDEIREALNNPAPSPSKPQTHPVASGGSGS